MWKRVVELLKKFMSVKGIFTVYASIMYCLNPMELNNLYLVLISWGEFISAREAYKIITLFIKGRSDDKL